MCCNDDDDETWQAANAICCMSAYRVKTCPRPWERWRLKNILRDNLENNNVFAEILQIVPGDSKTYFSGSSGGWKTCSRLDTRTSMGACPVQTIVGTLPPACSEDSKTYSKCFREFKNQFKTSLGALDTQTHAQNVSGSSNINSKRSWEIWRFKNILKTVTWTFKDFYSPRLPHSSISLSVPLTSHSRIPLSHSWVHVLLISEFSLIGK